MAKTKATELIEKWLTEFEHAAEYELHRTEFVKEGEGWYLRVYVDKLDPDAEDGYGLISTDDCELISRYLSDKLDEADPIKQNYVLEVSSPGMDRPLVTEKDFVRFAGQQVEVKLYKAQDGKKAFAGALKEKAPEHLVITDEKGKDITIDNENLAKINLAVIF